MTDNGGIKAPPITGGFNGTAGKTSSESLSINRRKSEKLSVTRTARQEIKNSQKIENALDRVDDQFRKNVANIAATPAPLLTYSLGSDDPHAVQKKYVGEVNNWSHQRERLSSFAVTSREKIRQGGLTLSGEFRTKSRTTSSKSSPKIASQAQRQLSSKFSNTTKSCSKARLQFNVRNSREFSRGR